MDLTNSMAKYNTAKKVMDAITAQVSAQAGKEFAEQFFEPFTLNNCASRELVRDIAAAVAQKVLEVETLRLMEHVEADPDNHIRAIWLRQLTKQVVKAVHDTNVRGDLREIADRL